MYDTTECKKIFREGGKKAMKIGCFGKLIIKCSIEFRGGNQKNFLEAIFSHCASEARVKRIQTSYLSSIRSVITNLCLFYYGDHFFLQVAVLNAVFEEGSLGSGVK